MRITETRAILLLILSVFVFYLIQPAPDLPPAPSPPTATPVPGLQPVIESGVGFLEGQYNPDYGLLQESPNVGKHRYYLTNDNALAAYVFETVEKDQLAGDLRQAIARYGVASNNFIEVAWGEKISWPPRHHSDTPVHTFGSGNCDVPGKAEMEPIVDCVIQEIHVDKLGHFYDWSSFSNLACMGAINEYNMGNVETARRLLEIKMADFDGFGFADKVYWESEKMGYYPRTYETLGLAWCLYASALLDVPTNEGVLSALLDQQDSVSGGFYTHYQEGKPRQADPNVETTSVALLALLTLTGDHDISRLGIPNDYIHPNPFSNYLE